VAQRNVSVKFTAEVQNFKAGMAEAAAATEKAKIASEGVGKATEAAGKQSADASKLASEAAAKHADALQNVGGVAMAAGALTLAGVGLAVKSYADFDKQMSSVDAATHETAANMDLLRKAAISAGADTAFSAVEAAKGIEEMAKAGVSTKDILGGGLNGALALAAAGSLDVGVAAEIASSAMTQFKLSGDKIPHLADLLAAGAGKAQGSVEDLGAALNQSGLIASQTGLTIEETTGGLAAFASAGLTGSDAGTSFKTMLQALTPNSAKAATAMSELGISAYDSQGNFVGLSEFAGQLKESLSGLTAEQRNSTLETIFGSDAVRAAAVLYEQGAEGINKWESAVNDAGYAADTAARMQDNLAGDLEKLGGAFDTALIQSGSGANEVLRGLVQGLEGLVDAVGRVPAPVLGAATGLAALVGGAALIGGTLITVIPKIRDTKDALQTLAPAGSRAATAIDKVGKALGIATTAIVGFELVKGLHNSMQAPTASLEKFTQALVGLDKEKSALDGIFKDIGAKEFEGQINGAGDALNKLINQDFNSAVEAFGASIGVDNGMAKLADGITKADKAIASAVGSGDMELAAEGFKSIADSAKEKGVSLEETSKKFPDYLDSLRKMASDSKVALTDQELLNWAMGETPAKMEAAAKSTDGAATSMGKVGAASADAALKAEEIEKALAEVGLAADGSVADIDKFTQSLFNAGLIHLSASSASIAYQAAIDSLTESVVTNGTSLDINTEKGRANRSAFDGLAQAAMNAATATATETLATQGADAALVGLQGSLRTSYDDLVRAAGQFGITGDEADTMARKALGIPKEVPIDTWVNDNATAKLDALKAKADNLDGRVVRTTIETINRQINTSEYREDPSMAALNPDSHATGGRVRGYSGGGKLPSNGPGTSITDGFLGISSAGVPLARVDKDEWIINGQSSNRYNRELAAINAGTFPKLPGYANGARMGREYSAQSLGYRPASAASNVSVAAPAVTVMIGNEQLDSRMYRVAGSAISSADSQSQLRRAGR